MGRRDLDAENLASNEDWEGNNAAFSCPQCGKVFIVSGLLHRDGRECPSCGGAKGYVSGGRQSEGAAHIEW